MFLLFYVSKNDKAKRWEFLCTEFRSKKHAEEIIDSTVLKYEIVRVTFNPLRFKVVT